MKHYITVSLDNIILMGFDTERKAANAIEELESYENNYHGCTWSMENVKRVIFSHG